MPADAFQRAERREAALFSVFDRTGAVELAAQPWNKALRIYATGGTRAHFAEFGVTAHDVGELTGFPALFDGRVKTLHPNIFGGILADRDNPAHVAEAERHGLVSIGTVVVNLYPFETTAARDGTTDEEAIEQIDIGGVALIRAAAKNFAHVAVLVDPSQYASLSSRAAGRPGSLRCAARWRREPSSERPSTMRRSRAT